MYGSAIVDANWSMAQDFQVAADGIAQRATMSIAAGRCGRKDPDVESNGGRVCAAWSVGPHSDAVVGAVDRRGVVDV